MVMRTTYRMHGCSTSAKLSIELMVPSILDDLCNPCYVAVSGGFTYVIDGMYARLSIAALGQHNTTYMRALRVSSHTRICCDQGRNLALDCNKFLMYQQ